MPKKPKDQSREEKQWVRKSTYLFLYDACNAYGARSPAIHAADAQTFCATCRLRPSTRNRRWCKGTRYTSPLQLWREAPPPLRVLDGWYMIRSFRVPVRWYIHSGSQMADTFVKGLRWMRPPFRVSDGCYLRWGFRDGWDLYFWFQVGCSLQGSFQFLNPKP